MTLDATITRYVYNWGGLALLVAMGACGRESEPRDRDGPSDTGSRAGAQNWGGSTDVPEEGGGGDLENSCGGPRAMAGRGPAPDGGSEAADGGDAPAGTEAGGSGAGDHGAEGHATGGSSPEGGTSSGGAGDGGSGGTSTGGQTPVNHCVDFTDRTGESAERQIAWNFDVTSDEERCMEIRVGQSVTWRGNFVFHPLAGIGGSTPTPILRKSDGSGAHAVLFSDEGTFGFICEAHVEMRGAVRVLP